MNKRSYAKETRTALFQGEPATVTHLTPLLTAEERAKRKLEIENQLYNVFAKYSGNRKSAAAFANK